MVRAVTYALWVVLIAGVCRPSCVTAAQQSPATVFSSEGATLVFTSSVWSLLLPLGATKAAPKTGIFTMGSNIYGFNAPRLKAPKAALGSVKLPKAVFLTSATLQPVSLASSGGTNASTPQKLSLRLNGPKQEAAIKDIANTNMQLQGSLPYAIQLGASAKGVAGLTSGFTLKAAPKLKKSGNTIVLQVPSTYSVMLLTEGTASVVCANGYGGTLQSDASATPSGCSICPAGFAGSGLDFSMPCSKCKDAGAQAYSAALGAAKCSICPGSIPANADGTGCSSSSGTPVLKAFASLFINTSTCTASLIDAANTAYTEYIKSRPGVDPATVSVTVTCADLAGTARRRHLSAGDVGIVLQVGFQYSGPKEVAAEAVQSTNDCCPPKDGCGKSEVCAAPSLAGIKITGGAGSTSDPAGSCAGSTCSRLGSYCLPASKDPRGYVCACKDGYEGDSCSTCKAGSGYSQVSKPGEELQCGCAFEASDTFPVKIPDGSYDPYYGYIPGNLASTSVDLADDKRTVSALTVCVNISHTYYADLTVWVEKDDFQVVLMDPLGGDGSADLTFDVLYCFNDGAATPWPRNMMGGAVPGGTYRPVEPLSAFAGLQTGGQWTLKAQDFWQTDAGMLGGFTLKLDSCSEGCAANTFYSTASRKCSACVANSTSSSRSFACSCTDAGRSWDVASNTCGCIVSADPSLFPAVIPNNSPSPYTLGSPLTVKFTVADATTTVNGVKVCVKLHHYYYSDLQLYVKKGAQQVRLFGVLGEANDGPAPVLPGGFYCFTDAAAKPFPVGAAYAVPYGNYKPASPLSLFDGQPVGGEWQVIAYDAYWYDSGALMGVQLYFPTCFTACAAGTFYDLDTATCATCPTGATSNAGSDRCTCADGYYLASPKAASCTQCGTGSSAKAGATACTCDPVTKAGYVWNATTNACDCPLTKAIYDPIGGTCTSCSPYATVVAGACQCNTGFVGDGFLCFGFNITLVNVGDNPTLDGLYAAAKAKWESIIIADLPDMPAGRDYTNGAFNDLSPGFQWTQAVDDIVIFYEVTTIDGPSNILGMAGGFLDRADGSMTPVSGGMVFDVDDVNDDRLAGAVNSTTWKQYWGAVILHEMGHLLGINDGLWEARGCMYGCRPNHPEDTVYYLCKNARREFQATPTCSGNLILETAAGGGSACAHWAEKQLDAELMTPYAERGGVAMPLSRITAGALEDLYGIGSINYNSTDNYACPSSTVWGISAASVAARDGGPAGKWAPNIVGLGSRSAVPVPGVPFTAPKRGEVDEAFARQLAAGLPWQSQAIGPSVLGSREPTVTTPLATLPSSSIRVGEASKLARLGPPTARASPAAVVAPRIGRAAAVGLRPSKRANRP